MANLCSTQLCFVSKNKKPLLTIQASIQKCFNNKNNGVRDVLIANGIPSVTAKAKTDGRDYVEDFDEKITRDGDKNFRLYVMTTTAWGPNMAGWFHLMKKKFGKVKLFYKSEEPGNEVYCTNDGDRKYFHEWFVCDYHVRDMEGTEYFDTKEELLQFIRKEFQTYVNDYESLDMIKGRILGHHYQGKNCKGGDYLSINEFRYDTGHLAA